MSNPARCKTHFIEQFEKRAWETIERFDLIQEGERICVAASGGKDSLALLHILSKKYAVDALSVDEGIPGYRDSTLDDLREYCADNRVNLRIVSFEDLGAEPLYKQNPAHPCSACGVLRRKALLDYTIEYDLVATGHNLDDEAQSIMMNLLRNQQHLLARLGPRTAARDGVAARIKPFYLTPEKEIRAYCILQGITSNFSECPNIVKSFRWQVQEALNTLEREQPGSKLNIVEEFLSRTYTEEESNLRCQECGGPSSSSLCRACQIIHAS